MKNFGNKIIVVVGPTSSGKSDLAQEIALRINGEILNADSMQIYKYMDIGTGKVLPNDRKVPHYGLDLLDPCLPYSAAAFQEYGRDIINHIKNQNKIPIISGGTGFYIRAVVDDYNFAEGDNIDNTIREKYELFLNQNGKDAIYNLLISKDQKSAQVIEKNDTKRVIRALELNERGDTHYENYRSLSTIEPFYDAIWIGMKVDTSELNSRIAKRVDNMIESGLVDEVTHLIDLGFEKSICSAKAIGYREIIDYLNNKITLDDAVQKIKTNTRRYAKRQRTWFRKESRINWINANSSNKNSILDEALSLIAN